MSYLVAIVAFVLFSLSTRIPWKVVAAVLAFFFLAVSIVFAASTGLYQWFIANAVSPVFGWVGSWIGATGGQVAGALVVIGAATILVVLTVKREMDKEVMTGLALCGFLVALAGGPVAEMVVMFTSGITEIGNGTVARWIGA